MFRAFPADTEAAVLKGWSFCGQILRICDVPHLQAIRSLIPFGLVRRYVGGPESSLYHVGWL
jgi:hypothetical protein